ncbi:hypothetical protein PR001_g10074 [Phytophthora rubi]|uniref:Tc1-like transposase DDE domain-containing protein n=1 Tax=Phytophthora rubi TaxID=129364 RepID=A0A6A3MW54_9STRA|nr:hypothetical protein PR001_g10074 [Phytophthora rubi]
MTVEVVSKHEELIDEDCRMTLEQLRDRLHSDLGVDVSVASVHRALQGMLYSTKRLRIEKEMMNSSVNKEKCKTFVAELNKPIKKGNMTHEGSVKKQENARFMAGLFVAALRSEEYEELQPVKVVIVTDDSPSHSEVESLALVYLAADGIVNLNKFVVLRLGPYSPMLNPIEGCWN